jgi:hypothetical protein
MKEKSRIQIKRRVIFGKKLLLKEEFKPVKKAAQSKNFLLLVEKGIERERKTRNLLFEKVRTK